MHDLLQEKHLIPSNCQRLYVDVGVAIDAPNSANWLLKDDKSYVIGIEPYDKNIEILKSGRPPTMSFPYLCLNDNTIIENGKVAGNIDGRFNILNCAIDNVDEPTSAPFYRTDSRNTGCSSLLKPTEKLGLDVVSEEEVSVYSLKMILKNLLNERFDKISILKTDCQGKDLDVVKSLGNLLNKTCCIQMEVNTNRQYHNEQSVDDIETFLNENSFKIIYKGLYDWIAINMNIPSEELNKYIPSRIRFIDT